MNVHTISSSKNPYMCAGIVSIPAILNTVIPSSTMNTNIAKKIIFHGVRYTLLSRTCMLNSLMNNTMTIITNPRLYIGAASARLAERLILHNLLLRLFV